MDDEECQEFIRPPEWLRLVPSSVEGADMVADGEGQVEDWNDDGDLVLGDQEPHQARLEHVGREEGEKHDDQGEDQAHILDTAMQTLSSILTMNNYC